MEETGVPGGNHRDRYLSMQRMSEDVEVPDDRDELYKNKTTKYPFLDPSDKRLSMTDEEIIRRDVDLADCVLSEPDKKVLESLLCENKQAFLL